MDESQFRALCKACDEILLERGAEPECLAVAWLHLVREHPVFLDRYERLFDWPVKNWMQWLGVKRGLIEVMRTLRQLLRAVRRELCREPVISASADILFVSHRVNSSSTENDFYFGSLPEELAALGKRVTIALIDHTDDSGAVPRVFPGRHKNLQHILLPNVARFDEEFRMLLGQLRFALNFSNEIDRATLSGKVRIAATAEALASAAFHTLRISRQISELAERQKPGFLISTYEGHAWERATFQLVRRNQLGIKCVGYQHAALFRLQHSIRRKLGYGSDPDAIWTSGIFAAEQLSHESRLEGTKIAVVGSIRVPEELTPIRNSQRHRKSAFTCLVLPEGLKSECNFLFEFALECAAVYPNANFIWRLHPVIGFEQLCKENPRFREIPRNVSISSQSLLDDILKSDCALYRGSTAVIHAVQAGVVPIYVQKEKELCIDPLYGARIGVGRIFEPIELEHAAEKESAETNSSFIRSYCRNLVSPMLPAAEVMRLLDEL